MKMKYLKEIARRSRTDAKITKRKEIFIIYERCESYAKNGWTFEHSAIF